MLFVDIFQILHSINVFVFTAEDEQSAESESCGKALIVLSWVLVIITMPFSLFVCFKVSSIFHQFQRRLQILSNGRK